MAIEGISNGLPIRLAVLWFASNDQPTPSSLGRDLLKSLDQVFETFIGSDASKEEHYSILLWNPKSLPCFVWPQIRVRYSVVDTKGNDRNPPARHIELCNHFPLHLFRMDKEMID